jgi:ABC-type glycerol-3-phosphate transport system substrate-binding protein
VSKDPEIREAFIELKELRDSKVVAPINDWTPDWEKAFADGTIASSLIGNWMKFFLPKYAIGQQGKWAVAQFPEIADSIGGSEAGGSIFVIPTAAKNKEAAREVFNRIFLTKKGNLAMMQQPGHEAWLPVLEDTIIDSTVLTSDSFFGPSLYKAEAKALKSYKVFAFSPNADLEFRIMNQYLNKYLNGTMPLNDALRTAEADMRDQIGN